MSKLAIGLEYNGANYQGWQRQPELANVRTVQEAVENAISAIANHPVQTVCAGRTDAGVHALGQVVHCEVHAKRDMYNWLMGINTKLPPDIRALWVKPVPDDFDARKSAISRSYRYFIYNHPIRPSIMREYYTWHFLPLDADLMHQAAQYWLGSHDFSSFRGAGCQSKSPVRELTLVNVYRRDELVIFDIMGNAFLYHMVRNMVGTLLQIGCGKKPVTWAQQVLAAKSRTAASITAPAHGLFLIEAKYPDRYQIVQQGREI